PPGALPGGGPALRRGAGDGGSPPRSGHDEGGAGVGGASGGGLAPPGDVGRRPPGDGPCRRTWARLARTDLQALRLALAALALTACSARLDHVFGAYVYDPVQDCLQAPATVDVIAGADPGMCPQLRCWQGPDGSIYVTSTACDAPPDYQDHTNDSSGPCV